jgi:hypothetical protein
VRRGRCLRCLSSTPNSVLWRGRIAHSVAAERG